MMAGVTEALVTTVALAASNRLAHFPDAVRLPDGGLLCAYREGVGHLGQDGRVAIVSSMDSGWSWAPPRVVVDGSRDARDPKLAVLADGTVLLTYFVLDWHGPRAHTPMGTFVRRSEDGGRTWSEPARVGTRMAWAATHGPILELPGGRLLAPLYGAPELGARQIATVVASDDGGRSFDAATEAVMCAVDEIHCQEPTLVTVPDSFGSRVVALVRTTDAYARLARSRDGGVTWGEPEPTDLPASSHHTLPLVGGGVLVTYGDTSHRFSPRRATTGRLVPDAGGDWCGHPDRLLYDSGHDDQANPSSVELAGGDLLTFSFDVGTATVVAVRTRRSDYS
jgi:hypothetical protein